MPPTYNPKASRPKSIANPTSTNILSNQPQCTALKLHHNPSKIQSEKTLHRFDNHFVEISSRPYRLLPLEFLRLRTVVKMEDLRRNRLCIYLEHWLRTRADCPAGLSACHHIRFFEKSFREILKIEISFEKVRTRNRLARKSVREIIFENLPRCFQAWWWRHNLNIFANAFP